MILFLGMTSYRKEQNTENSVGLLLISAAMMLSHSAIEDGNAKPAPLIIQEQGSFAVGGTALTNPGTFDPSQNIS